MGAGKGKNRRVLTAAGSTANGGEVARLLEQLKKDKAFERGGANKLSAYGKFA